MVDLYQLMKASPIAMPSIVVLIQFPIPVWHLIISNAMRIYHEQRRASTMINYMCRAVADENPVLGGDLVKFCHHLSPI